MDIFSKSCCLSVCLFILWSFISVHSKDISGKPCVSRQILPNRSTVCVCNSTYCDTLIREQPVLGSFIAYTTSNSGLRFRKTYGQFREGYQPCGEKIYVLNPYKRYQGIIGFGGAVTDSAAYTWKSLSKGAQKNMINAYFSNTGSEYNVIRTPVGGSDFSLRLYSYNERPVNDFKLSNFTLTVEDTELKIPMIKQSQKVATVKIMVFGSVWSPPPWMKDNNAYDGMGRLKLEHYQTYADYHCRFAEKYKKEGIDLWGFTTTNEPLNGIFPLSRFQSLGFNTSGMAQYIQENLGPTLREQCSVQNLKIMAVDDQRTTIPLYFNSLSQHSTNTLDFIEGVAVHWYANLYTPATLLSDIIREYPQKFIMSTEASNGYKASDIPKVDYGSWERANYYITDILENLRNMVSGWVDWNLCLNMEGGPNWRSNFLDSPVIVNADADEFYKQPMYYALAHFSKFLPPGSRRIKVVDTPTEAVTKEFYFYDCEDIVPHYDQVAFLTPRNTIVFIIQNTDDRKTVTIQLGEQQIVTTLEAESITTIEFPYPASSIYDDMPEYVKNARA